MMQDSLHDPRAFAWSRSRVAGSGYLPLLPRHKITLTSFVEDGERFAGLFRQAWARIPIGCRRSMLRHWRTPSPAVRSFVLLTPSIELASDWSGRERETIGVCSAHGHKLLFRSDRVNAMPDALVEDLIAHELAHVWQWSTGDSAEDFASEDAFWIEHEADNLMESWGFDPEAMDAWAASQGLAKVWTEEEWAKLSPSQLKRLRAKAKRSGRGLGLFV